MEDRRKLTESYELAADLSGGCILTLGIVLLELIRQVPFALETTMIRNFSVLTFALVVGLGGIWAADEPILLKVKKAGPGERFQKSNAELMDLITLATVNGQENKQEAQQGAAFQYTEEVMERADLTKKATKMKRVYEKAEGMERGEATEFGLAGKTVVIEKGKDGYTFTADGKPLEGAAAAKLGKEFSKDKPEIETEDVLFPKKPVKPGDTWEIDGNLLGQAFARDMEIDVKKVKAVGKLVKLYDLDGQKHGVMEFTIELPLLKMITPNGPIDISQGGSFVKLEMTGDGCVDGTSLNRSLKGVVTSKLFWKQGTADVAVTMNGKMESKTEATKK
jgi:hypothetical protein